MNHESSISSPQRHLVIDRVVQIMDPAFLKIIQPGQLHAIQVGIMNAQLGIMRAELNAMEEVTKKIEGMKF